MEEKEKKEEKKKKNVWRIGILMTYEDKPRGQKSIHSRNIYKLTS